MRIQAYTSLIYLYDLFKEQIFQLYPLLIKEIIMTRGILDTNSYVKLSSCEFLLHVLLDGMDGSEGIGTASTIQCIEENLSALIPGLISALRYTENDGFNYCEEAAADPSLELSKSSISWGGIP